MNRARRMLLILMSGAIILSASATPAAAYSPTKLLAKITIAPEADANTYSRSAYPHWASLGKSGCNTRVDVLIAEAIRIKKQGCSIKSGLWKSAYDGKSFREPGKLDIDHFVPLGQAHRSGASKWNTATRKAYANDQGYAGSLIAVSAASNRSKSDQDPSEWMPSKKSYQCKYIGNWVAIKYRWSLTIDVDELSTVKKFLKKCGKKSDVPRPKVMPIVLVNDDGAESTPPAPDPSGTDTKYNTCAEARVMVTGRITRVKILSMSGTATATMTASSATSCDE